MRKTTKLTLTGLLFAAASMGASCPSTGIPVPVGSLSITSTIRTACSTTSGYPLEDAYLTEQLLTVDALRANGSSKTEAIQASLSACIERINLPCEVVDCAFEEELPLKVNCADCAAAIADQVFGN